MASPGETVIPFPGKNTRMNRDELAFLPAALEIMETPPSPAGRAIALTLSSFLVVSIGWACLSEIDIVSTAPGKIIPSDNSKIIQPFETGVVRAIRVADGQTVKAGDVLIELDATVNGAERERLASDYTSATLDVARLRAALTEIGDPKLKPGSTFKPPVEASQAQGLVHRLLLEQQVEEQRSKINYLERQKAQKQAERATAQTGITKLNATLPIVKEREQMRKYLAEKEIGSKILYLELHQDVTDKEQELLVQKSRLLEADAAVATIQEQRRQTEAEFRRTHLNELAQAEQKAASLRQELIKADQRTNLQSLTAPVDGTVQQLAIHTIGGVVTPAQSLMTIVPTGSTLTIEASIPNRDIGFVQPGQEAEIKIDTFNFTKYGLIRGVVTTVSQDAVSRDRLPDANGKSDGKAPAAAAAGGSNQELVYAARVSLERSTMTVDNGRVVNLGPGMAVTVEIKTGSRRLIEYILSPVLRYRQESLRER